MTQGDIYVHGMEYQDKYKVPIATSFITSPYETIPLMGQGDTFFEGLRGGTTTLSQVSRVAEWEVVIGRDASRAGDIRTGRHTKGDNSTGWSSIFREKILSPTKEEER